MGLSAVQAQSSLEQGDAAVTVRTLRGLGQVAAPAQSVLGQQGSAHPAVLPWPAAAAGWRAQRVRSAPVVPALGAECLGLQARCAA